MLREKALPVHQQVFVLISPPTVPHSNASGCNAFNYCWMLSVCFPNKKCIIFILKARAQPETAIANMLALFC